MAQNPNQFKQSVEKGQVDLQMSLGTVMSVQVDAAQVAALVPGQAVTIVDSAGGIPKVIAAAADTNDIFGFVAYDFRKSSFAALEKCEIVFFRGGVMYMEASAAIARGAQVMPVISGQKVATAAGTGKRIIGRALDKAAANGDLIRVLVDVPGATVP